MARRISLDTDKGILVDQASLNFMSFHSVSLIVGWLEARYSLLNIRSVGGQDMFCHAAQSSWAVNVQWLLSLEYPGGKHQVWITGGVICMQVSEESQVQSARLQSYDAGLVSGCRASNDPRAEVDQVGLVVHNDRY